LELGPERKHRIDIRPSARTGSADIGMPRASSRPDITLSVLGANRIVPRRQQQPFDLLQQALEFDRLGIELVAASLQSAVAIRLQRMGCQGDDRDHPAVPARLYSPGCLPSIHDREAEIHEDEVRVVTQSPFTTFGPVHRYHHSVPAAFQPPAQHIAIHFVVFDQQYSRHPVPFA
jgi:hypothetical protein